MIKAANLSRIRTMDFFLVMSNIKDYAEKEDLETLRLKEFFDQEFVPALQGFDVSLKPARQKELTKEIHKMDSLRAKYYVGLKMHLRALKNFPEVSVSEASVRLRATIDTFGKKIHVLPLAEETAIIINLLQELDKDNNKADIKLTGVEKWVTQMRKTNDALHTLFKERINKEASTPVGKTQNSREIMQKVFTDFCNRVNALALIEGEAPYRTLIDNINREIDRAKIVKKQRDNSNKGTTNPDINNIGKQKPEP